MYNISIIDNMISLYTRKGGPVPTHGLTGLSGRGVRKHTWRTVLELFNPRKVVFDGPEKERFRTVSATESVML